MHANYFKEHSLIIVNSESIFWKNIYLRVLRSQHFLNQHNQHCIGKRLSKP